MTPFTRLTLIIAVILLLPWLALVGLGGYWLWLKGGLYYGLGILSASIALAYLLIQVHRRHIKPSFIETKRSTANPNWASQELQAWQTIETLSEEWCQRTGEAFDLKTLTVLTNEVIATVARHYHAQSSHPILEFPVPYLLKLIVLVCEDIQQEVLDKIPGSHAIRVADLIRARQAANTFRQAASWFSVAHWLFNWPGAALAKAREVLFKKGLATVATEINQRLIEIYINKLGYYTIQLYSGQLTLDDWMPTEKMTAYSKTDTEKSKSEPVVEPLRVLLIGQVSSGKSSLVNALFGEIKSAASWLPTTAKITPYVLERDGLKQAIILDSAGYGGLEHPDAAAAIKQEWMKTDVILLVLKASHAARDEDRQQVQAIRAYFQTECRNQALPVIIAVVTHIDQLRPLREWQPPYNINQPGNAKAQTIRKACDAIAQDLHLPLSQIVPVCLAADQPVYNVDDGLLPVIHEHLNAAQRVRYLRCLRKQQAEGYWRQWRKQMANLGQVILDRL